MSTEDVEEFSYDGLLVFNGIYTTSVLDSDFDFERVVSDELIDYSKGSFDKPGRGYQTLSFRRYMKEDPKIGHDIVDLLGELHALRYLEEEWEYHEVDLDGTTDRRPAKTGVSSFDAYWSSPDHLFIKGNKTQANRASKLLSMTLEDYLDIRELTFSPDFLLWIFSCEKNNEDLLGEISVNMLTDAEISGNEPDLFGQRNKVDDSTDITKSTPVLMGVLQQKGLVALEGVFGLGDKFVRARISTEGRIHIKADHAIEGSTDIERMSISIAFLKEFTRLYKEWQKLDAEQRYPPTDFFKDIYKECERQGVEIQFSIDDVIQKYRQKGGLEEYQQYQSGLGDFE